MIGLPRRRMAFGFLGTVAALGFATGFARAPEAQELAGVVVAAGSQVPVEAAVVTLHEGSGAVTASATTDAAGRFVLSLARPLTDTGAMLVVRRLGFRPDSVTVSALSFPVRVALVEVALLTDDVRVIGHPSVNQVRLDEARRRGWRVYGPEQVAPYRERARSLSFLFQLMAVPGIVPARSSYDCIRSIRANQCLALVIDDIVTGPFGYVHPADVFFVAVMGAADSRMYWGERAPFGAIVIYTRSNTDAPASRRDSTPSIALDPR